MAKRFDLRVAGPEGLAAVLATHRAWLAGEPGGARATLRGANLTRATLRDADLHDADLRGADLRDADLHDADLRDADLHDADLRGADLRDADLHDADLTDADLRGANLADADLRGANLADAILTDADLADAENIPALAAAQTSILPAGDLIGWKKCMHGVLVQLRIPAEARRSNATGRKCRAEYADVLAVEGADVGVSQHDGVTTYRVGERVTAHEWCEDRWRECAGGVHFWVTREEAEAS